MKLKKQKRNQKRNAVKPGMVYHVPQLTTIVKTGRGYLKKKCSKCGEVISKGQKIVTYHSPYWKELHHKNLCFDGSEDDIILTSEDIPNHEDHVNRFVTALEVVKEDWSTELLAEIAGQDITMGNPSVELRALRIMNDRHGTTANPALVDNLLTQLEQGAIRPRVKLEASNLLLMEKLKTHKEENEEE